MIFAFGLPSYRFNDHAQRAVRASLDVQKSLTRMGMQAGVRHQHRHGVLRAHWLGHVPLRVRHCRRCRQHCGWQSFKIVEGQCLKVFASSIPKARLAFKGYGHVLLGPATEAEAIKHDMAGLNVVLHSKMKVKVLVEQGSKEKGRKSRSDNIPDLLVCLPVARILFLIWHFRSIMFYFLFCFADAQGKDDELMCPRPPRTGVGD
jgi:hypothetical protein